MDWQANNVGRSALGCGSAISCRLCGLSRSAQLLPACPATDGCGCTSSGTGAPPTAPPSCNITDKNTANNKKCNVS
ncbi:GD18655 [Drosophila simulans]|uniref:GD18655 n=1 Tax=Drosophila simulans TaxID=7240 RepID=B4QVW9_DROSI|nr:GD18655 [Drosophila simulans]